MQDEAGLGRPTRRRRDVDQEAGPAQPWRSDSDSPTSSGHNRGHLQISSPSIRLAAPPARPLRPRCDRAPPHHVPRRQDWPAGSHVASPLRIREGPRKAQRRFPRNPCRKHLSFLNSAAFSLFFLTLSLVSLFLHPHCCGAGELAVFREPIETPFPESGAGVYNSLVRLQFPPWHDLVLLI